MQWNGRSLIQDLVLLGLPVTSSLCVDQIQAVLTCCVNMYNAVFSLMLFMSGPHR